MLFVISYHWSYRVTNSFKGVGGRSCFNLLVKILIGSPLAAFIANAVHLLINTAKKSKLLKSTFGTKYHGICV